MSFPNQPDNSTTDFLPENYEWPEKGDEFAYQMKRRYRRIASNINGREIANYLAYTPDLAGTNTTVEVLTGQQWFILPGAANYNEAQTRTSFRKVVRFPNALVVGINTQAHNIVLGAPSTYTFTCISGVIQNQATPFFVPVPNDTVLVEVDATNVRITIPAAYIGFFAPGIVLEYLKA